MKPAFKCDYCNFMGAEEEVREHEPKCMKNYDRKSCYTCEHRGRLGAVNGLIKYECRKAIDVPAGKVVEFCGLYEGRQESNGSLSELTRSMFGVW